MLRPSKLRFFVIMRYVPSYCRGERRRNFYDCQRGVQRRIDSSVHRGHNSPAIRSNRFQRWLERCVLRHHLCRRFPRPWNCSFQLHWVLPVKTGHKSPVIDATKCWVWQDKFPRACPQLVQQVIVSTSIFGTIVVPVSLSLNCLLIFIQMRLHDIYICRLFWNNIVLWYIIHK